VNEVGIMEKHKACLVANKYKQELRVDYKEVFAPVVKQDTIQLVLSIAAQHSWSIFHKDVKSSFLHEDLQKYVYIK
jgi:hypothetical protein